MLVGGDTTGRPSTRSSFLGHRGAIVDERKSLWTRRGNCYDNAVMEAAFFSSVKAELRERVRQPRRREEGELFTYIEVFYNQRRRHSTWIGYVSPAAFEQRAVSTGYGCVMRGIFRIGQIDAMKKSLRMPQERLSRGGVATLVPPLFEDTYPQRGVFRA